jgi:hypothetical protein
MNRDVIDAYLSHVTHRFCGVDIPLELYPYMGSNPSN